MNERTRLEQAAVDAHEAGDTWNQFWPTVAADVSALHLGDYAAYRRVVRRLVALVAAGDVDGGEPVPNGWSEPMPWEVDDQAQAVPVLITSDVGTRAYVDWHLVNRPAALLPIRRRSSPPVPELPGKGNNATTRCGR